MRFAAGLLMIFTFVGLGTLLRFIFFILQKIYRATRNNVLYGYIGDREAEITCKDNVIHYKIKDVNKTYPKSSLTHTIASYEDGKVIFRYPSSVVEMRRTKRNKARNFIERINQGTKIHTTSLKELEKLYEAPFIVFNEDKVMGEMKIYHSISRSKASLTVHLSAPNPALVGSVEMGWTPMGQIMVHKRVANEIEGWDVSELLDDIIANAKGFLKISN